MRACKKGRATSAHRGDLGAFGDVGEQRGARLHTRIRRGITTRHRLWSGNGTRAGAGGRQRSETSIVRGVVLGLQLVLISVLVLEQA